MRGMYLACGHTTYHSGTLSGNRLTVQYHGLHVVPDFSPFISCMRYAWYMYIHIYGENHAYMGRDR